jgi:Xaa-Pro aminopeptidase
VDHRVRRAALTRTIDEQDVDAILVTSMPNVRYLTGFTGSNAQIVIARSQSLFFTDGRYTEQSRHEVPDVERVTYLGGFGAPLETACDRLDIARLGFEAHDMTVADRDELQRRLSSVDLVPVGKSVEQLRWAKDDEEREMLREAQACTDRAFEDILDTLAVGMSERQVSLELEQAMRRAGADGLSFESIVAFGENAAEPHHRPNHRLLDEGDVITMDFGALYGGYHADLTRTIAFGQPAPELAKIHDIVREAQQAGIDAVRAGVTGGEVDQAARRVVEDAGYGERFTHGLGHGVGLEIHEGPNFARGGEDVLPVGAVVTVEPGIYVPGLGGVRIEDMVAVEESGCSVVGSSIRELVEL